MYIDFSHFLQKGFWNSNYKKILMELRGGGEAALNGVALEEKLKKLGEVCGSEFIAAIEKVRESNFQGWLNSVLFHTYNLETY